MTHNFNCTVCYNLLYINLYTLMNKLLSVMAEFWYKFSMLMVRAHQLGSTLFGAIHALLKLQADDFCGNLLQFFALFKKVLFELIILS